MNCVRLNFKNNGKSNICIFNLNQKEVVDLISCLFFQSKKKLKNGDVKKKNY